MTASQRHRTLPAWVWLALFAVALIGLLAMVTAPGVPAIVVWPMAALIAVVGALVGLLWRRRRGLVPWFEIGVVYACIVALYGVYPIVKFLVVGEHFNAPSLDVRWSQLDPTPGEVAYLGWIYAFHLAAFAIVYATMRGRGPISALPLRPPLTAAFIAVVAIFALVQGFWIYLGLFYDTSASSYIESYLVSRRLPLLLAQLLNHLNGAKYPLSLVILAGLFSRYRTSRHYIAGWILVTVVLTFTRLGSRTEMALLVMSAAMMYHLLVRPISPWAIGAGVGGGIATFVLLGLLRNGWLGDSDGTVNPIMYAGEFDVLFLNALELARVKAAGTLGPVPWTLYFTDLAALVPQQLAPFQKVEAASWYVNRFYPEYAAMGGGLAFGTMAEAALTGGLLSGLARGAALGFIFAWIHRLYIRRGDRYWVLVFYVWATTLSYQAFRATTFYLLVLFVFRFIPVVIGVRLLASALRRAAIHTRGWLQPQSAERASEPSAGALDSPSA